MCSCPLCLAICTIEGKTKCNWRRSSPSKTFLACMYFQFYVLYVCPTIFFTYLWLLWILSSVTWNFMMFLTRINKNCVFVTSSTYTSWVWKRINYFRFIRDSELFEQKRLFYCGNSSFHGEFLFKVWTYAYGIGIRITSLVPETRIFRSKVDF